MTRVQVDEVVVNFADPAGLVANEGLVLDCIRDGVRFQVFVDGHPTVVPQDRRGAAALIASLR